MTKTPHLVKTPKIFGWRWVGWSTYDMMQASGFFLVGLLGLIVFLGIGISKEDSVAIFVGVFCGGMFMSFPWFMIRSVFISPKNLWRPPQIERPCKVPLAEITHLWPVGNELLGSPVGNLIVVHADFTILGPEFAKLLDAEWLPSSAELLPPSGRDGMTN